MVLFDTLLLQRLMSLSITNVQDGNLLLRGQVCHVCSDQGKASGAQGAKVAQRCCTVDSSLFLQGLAEHRDELGAPLCPCRHYDDKAAEAKQGFWNCPCVPMRERKVTRCHSQSTLPPFAPHDL